MFCTVKYNDDTEEKKDYGSISDLVKDMELREEDEPQIIGYSWHKDDYNN